MSGDALKLSELSQTADLPDALEIEPVNRVRGRVQPPGSKSITNRALVVAALADGHCTLLGALDSQDTRIMVESWQRLGVRIEHDARREQIEVQGCAGVIPALSAELFCGNSGSSIRFLSAAVALGRGSYRLDGVPRMRTRPIEELLEALRSLGVDAQSEPGTGCPPVRIGTSGLGGGTVQMAGERSSQFLSAMLMAAPYAQGDLVLEATGQLVSEPFVQMTRQVMHAFGVEVQTPARGRYAVRAGQCYHARRYQIEPDATAASYFWAAAALTGGEVTVQGVGTESIQGDRAFVALLQRMGAEVRQQADSITVTGRSLHGIDADMRDISDTFLTLAVLAAFADGPTTIRGVAHSRAQETDRMAAIATELRRVGTEVDLSGDSLTIRPQSMHGGWVETHDDHRIAMSMALVGLRIPGIVIRRPECTAKTYPRFFYQLQRLLDTA